MEKKLKIFSKVSLYLKQKKIKSFQQSEFVSSSEKSKNF